MVGRYATAGVTVRGGILKNPTLTIASDGDSICGGQRFQVVDCGIRTRTGHQMAWESARYLWDPQSPQCFGWRLDTAQEH